MIYKEYGKTLKKVSALGLGGMRFKPGKNGYDIDKCAEIVLKAYELGINYFDTAPKYNSYLSEVIYGKAFSKMDREKFYVSTKSMAENASGLRKDLETSLKRMNLGKINFYHLWCVLTLDDFYERMKKNGPFYEAVKAKNEGLIEHICISTHCSGDEIKKIIDTDCFEGITLGYNILNFPYRQKGLKAAYEKGLGVATMNPLGGGILPQHPSLLSLENNVKHAVEKAISFNASHKEISVVLSGMSSIDEVIMNTDAVNKTNILTESNINSISSTLTKKMDNLCTGCGYCDSCPKGIEIPKLMQAYNNKIISDQRAAINNLKWHWEISPKTANTCIACRACEKKCTQHLPIVKRLKEMASWKFKF